MRAFVVRMGQPVLVVAWLAWFPGALVQAADRPAGAQPPASAPAYYLPLPLKYDSAELAELRKAGVARNTANLRAQIEEMNDRQAYLKERQQAAAVELNEKKVASQTDLGRRQWHAEHEKMVYSRQYFYSEVVFWVSNLIVLTGLGLTVRQFLRDEMGWKALYAHNLRVLQRRAISGSTKVEATLTPNPESETKLQLKSDGIEIGTRVTGLALLVISLGFYYLMLVHVYGITTETLTSSERVASGQKK